MYAYFREDAGGGWVAEKMEDVVCRLQALHVSLGRVRGRVRSGDGPELGVCGDAEALPANMWFEVVLSNGKKAAVRPAPYSD